MMIYAQHLAHWSKKHLFWNKKLILTPNTASKKKTHFWTTVHGKSNFSNMRFLKNCLLCYLYIVLTFLLLCQFRCETWCKKKKKASKKVISAIYTSNLHEYILSKMPFLFSFCSSNTCLYIVFVVFAHGKLHRERLAVFMIANFTRIANSLIYFRVQSDAAVEVLSLL